MTRREALGALGVAFALLAASLTWLLGPWGLLLTAAALAATTVFAFERVDSPRGEDVEGAVPRDLLAAIQRDFPL